MNALKIEFLRSILDYNPETGNFVWKKRNLGEYDAPEEAYKCYCEAILERSEYARIV